MSEPPNAIERPREWALLMLAAGELLPRQRARDQQADIAGNELKRRVLDRLIELDPDSAELAVALEQITQQLGEPVGPSRAIAGNVLEEFHTAQRSPELVAWLFHQALGQSSPSDTPRGRIGRS